MGVVDPVTLGPALSGGLCLVVAALVGWRWTTTGAVIALGAAVATGAAGLDARLRAQHWEALYPGITLCATEESRAGGLLPVPAARAGSALFGGG